MAYQANVASRDNSRIAMTHLRDGLSEGMLWAQVESERRLKTTAALYCVPENLSLNYENLIDIINKEIKLRYTPATQKEADTMAIAMLLINGLEQTFPCKQ
jgi:hypothetical protein